jgi:1,2-diacylglycerol-3-alpha-glucose alpha-1,2-glucosyltransferase
MKVNLANEMLGGQGGGIKNAADTFVRNLKKRGIDIKMNRMDNYDILHTNTIGPYCLSQIKVARLFKRKVIVHAHSTARELNDSFTFGDQLSKAALKYFKYFYNKGDLVLTPTEYSKKVLIEDGVTKPIEVLSNGINTEKFKPSNTHDKGYVYCVGHFFIKKGITTFSDLAEEFPDISFKWFGPVYNPIFVHPGKINEITENKPDNFEIMGFVPDIVKAHQDGRIFLFPSYEENEGIVILEAAACGKAIVVRDIPTYEGWLVDGVNCLKCKTDDDFKKAVGRLLQDEKLREKLGKEAIKLAESRSIDKSIDKLVKIYENILK